MTRRSVHSGSPYEELIGFRRGVRLGKVMTAGMTRLQHGLQEARDAAQAMIDSLKARKDHVLSYIAIIGTLGPLIGLVSARHDGYGMDGGLRMFAADSVIDGRGQAAKAFGEP